MIIVYTSMIHKAKLFLVGGEGFVTQSTTSMGIIVWHLELNSWVFKLSELSKFL